MTLEKKLKKYRQEIESSRKWRDEYSCIWDECVRLYHHRAEGKGIPHGSDVDAIQVNIIHSNINIIVASTTANDPTFIVDPRTRDDIAMAMVVENILNYYWENRNYMDEVRLSVKDSYIMGHGWLKVRWDRAESDSKPTKEESDDLTARAIEMANNIAETVPDFANLLPEDSKLREAVLSGPYQRITRDQAVIERVSPYQMLVDPYATSDRNMRWIAQEIWRPLDSVKQDKRFNKKARESVAGCARSATPDDKKSDLGEFAPDNDQNWVLYYEFYDLENNVMCIFSDTGDDFLAKPTPFPYALGQPFIHVADKSRVDCFYPMGEVEVIKDLQYELNATRSRMLNDLKWQKRGMMVRKDVLTEEDLEAFLEGKDNAVFQIDEDTAFGDVMAPVPNKQINADFYNMSAVIRGDMDNVSGTVDFQRGQSSATTATEAVFLNDSAQSRANEKIRIVYQAIETASHHIISLMQQFMGTSEVIRITGLGAGEAFERVISQGEGTVFDDDSIALGTRDSLFFTINQDMISGDYDFKVEAGSTSPRNSQTRRQEALQLATTMLQFAAFQGPDGGPLINIPELAKLILERGFDVKDVERFLNATTAVGQPAIAGTPAGGAAPGTGPNPVESGVGQGESSPQALRNFGGLANVDR